MSRDLSPCRSFIKEQRCSVAMQFGPKVGNVTLQGLDLGIMWVSGYNDLQELSGQPTVKMIKD